ncbi:MAG: glycosyltransferase [Mucilaginibacter sp.]
MQENRLNNLVSVIIPCYNAAAYLPDAIYSVLTQTYKAIEIIVVNDGSNDNSADVIKTFGDKVIAINQANQGVSKARNTGYACASGKYICFLDADDWFYPSNIQLKVDYLINNPQTGLVHSIVDVTDAELNSTGKYLRGKKGKNLVPALLNLELPIPCPSNVLIRREVLETVGLFDENLSTSADFELWVRACDQFETGMIAETGIKYRIHASSMFTNKTWYKNDVNYIFEKHAAGSIYNWNKFAYKNNFSLTLNAIRQKSIISTIYYFYNYLIFLIKSSIG